MDDRLLIPVSDLPGPLPLGAPAVCRVVIEGIHDDERTLRLMSPDDAASMVLDLHPSLVPRARPIYYLDLTPPPLDANGWPTRIDGLDVAAGMLAHAFGSGGPAWLERVGDDVWQIRAPYAIFTTFCARPVGMGWIHVAALADIDPTDPLADRLAMAACFRARVWEGR